ncbi:MAG TPA: DUF4337 domain-containing protein [Steroidobacteraceae bacterium]|nr:DUF4337 domain-containing protein [Steroidobacteraceae bacterium]
MAEIEIHHEHGHEDDPLAKRVGLMVGIIGVVLAVVTIAAHREHTAAVIERTAENDQWAYYQAKKIREHVSGVGRELALALGTDPAKVAAAVGKFDEQTAKYKHDAEELEKEARADEAATHRAERRALRFDLGEGFIELGLVLSSLYFLGRHRLFPLVGGASAVLGLAVALSALTIA